MKPVPFRYVRASSSEQALELLAKRGFSKLIAGGQTLGPMMNLRLVQPEQVVDIGGVEELRYRAVEKGMLEIGAAVTHAEIEDGHAEDPTTALLVRVASGIAYRAVRNRGTLGGSLAHCDPAAEWPSTMLALNATLALRDANGSERDVPADEFMVGPLMTVLGEREMVVSVRIPALAPSARTGFYKFCRKQGEFAHALAVVVFDELAKVIRVVLGTPGSRPLLLDSVARKLGDRSRHLSANTLRDAALADIQLCGLSADEYERQLFATAVTRAAQECLR
jgi:carbon-monoxide dehydrogenase medium subunit